MSNTAIHMSETELKQLQTRQQCVASDWYHPKLARAVKSPDIYQSREYLLAKKELADGRPCKLCGSTEDICAHHVIPNDNSSLIPLCRKCHAAVHGRVLARPDVRGKYPPVGESPPPCACGCKLRTSWKRYRGWAMYRHGHANAKVPAGTRTQDAPACKCGCGESVAFRHGKGWNEYKTGHRQRVEGHYRDKAGTRVEAPLCACGCDQPTQKAGRSNYPRYILGHRLIHAGRKPPLGEQPPKCKCGCGQETRWQPGHGWSSFAQGHQRRGKPGGMLGKKLTPEQRARCSEGAKRREARKREIREAIA